MFNKPRDKWLQTTYQYARTSVGEWFAISPNIAITVSNWWHLLVKLIGSVLLFWMRENNKRCEIAYHLRNTRSASRAISRWCRFRLSHDRTSGFLSDYLISWEICHVSGTTGRLMKRFVKRLHLRMLFSHRHLIWLDSNGK